MDVQSVSMTRAEAREPYRDYKAHLHYSKPVDQECMRAYQLLAQGRLIIRAIESVVAAGVKPNGYPKLALCRAHGDTCHLRLWRDGSAHMSHLEWPGSNNHCDVVRFRPGTFTGLKEWRADAQAIIPPVPLHMRPKRGLQNYHILWEAEWSKVMPVDPYLLRRIGKSDMWLVVAMWELTEVERLALATRLANA